jgi:tetratricopeptide (TPR) repeat protein
LPTLHSFHEPDPVGAAAFWFSSWSLAALLAWCALGWLLRREPRAPLFAALLLASLLPASGLLPMETPLAERYLYIPSAFFCALLAMALRRLPGPRLAVVSAIVGLVFAGSALVRCQDWQNWESLWTRTVVTSPNHPTAHYHLGYEWFMQGRLEEAIAEYEIGVTLNPRLRDLWRSKGDAHAEARQLRKAVAAYSKALEIDPEFTDAWFNLGLVLAAQERFAEARQHLMALLALDPDYPKGRKNLLRVEAGIKRAR